MTRHQRERFKCAVLVFTALLVSTMPAWSFSGFLWTVGTIGAVVVLISLGMAAEVYIGYRAFERRTAEKFRQLQVRDAARGPRRVVGYIGRDCR
jgi:hypothetical protein